MTKTIAESDIQLSQVDAAQNLTLLSILQDFEEQFEFKYGRKPQLLQKCASMVMPQFTSKFQNAAARAHTAIAKT